MTEQGRGIRDQGSGTDRADVGADSDTPDAVLDELLASFVTPRTPVDLRAAVLRRIEEERDSPAGWRGWNWRSATLAAAAAVIVMTTAVVMWRGSRPEPTDAVVQSTPASESAPDVARPGPAFGSAHTPSEGVTAVARVDRSSKTMSTRRASMANAAAVAEALPPLEPPAPLHLPAMTTDALQIERVQVSAPLEIAPLEIEQLDVDRPRNPQR